VLKVLKPATLTLVSSTALEPSDTDVINEYSATDAYAAGDVIYVAGSWNRLYECLAAHQGVASNSTGSTTISNGTPCVVTWGNSTYKDGTAITFSTTGALPEGLTVGTTYYIKNRETVNPPNKTQFNLTSTFGGSVLINTSAAGSGEHRLKTITTAPFLRLVGTDPLWLDRGPTNRHAMFDGKMSTGTQQTVGTVVTISIATPCVVGWVAHGLVDGSSLTLATTGTLPTGLTVGTTYYVISSTADTFQLAATLGGSAINTSGSQSGTQTAIADLCVVVSAGVCNYVAVLDVTGVVRVKLEMFDGTTVVHTETKSMYTVYVSNWYEYFYATSTVYRELLFGPLPPHPTATMKLTFTPALAGMTISCGMALFGNTTDIGDVEYGATAGITDYSRKDTDEYGNTSLIVRGFSKRATYQLQVPVNRLRQVFSAITALRAAPALWLATDDSNLTPLNIYGYPKDWGINVQYYGYVSFSIEIEGLLL